VIYAADTRAKVGIKTSIEHLQSSAFLLKYFVQQFIKEKTIFKDGQHIIPLDQISEKSVTMALLFQIVKDYGFNIEQCYDMQSANTGNLFYSQTHEALINRNTLIIRTNSPSEARISEQIDSLPWSLKLDTFEITMERVPTQKVFDKTSETLYLQEDGLTFPLTIRHWREGDVFKPLGLKGQKQKVKDFLINRKVNKFDKEKILVLISDNNIVAILMEGISDIVKVTSASSSCIKIQKRG
jgi:tRNA(Ile)-lysidine synthase